MSPKRGTGDVRASPVSGVRRRSLLRGAIAVGGLAVGGLATGCSDTSEPSSRARSGAPETGTRSPTAAARSVLLAYFSRPGENYYYGDRIDLEVGNTKVLAGMIADRIGCAVHEIQPVEPYPWDYEKTVRLNVREQDAEARPAIANPLRSIEAYEVVMLASPIWNVRTPRIMATFTEGLDFTGTTVYPITTHVMSGLGDAPDDYAATCSGATIGDGLAVRGEKVRDAGAQVDDWLERVDLL